MGSTRDSPAHANYTATDGPLPFVVSGLYDKLDERRQLCGSESIEEILDVTIDLIDLKGGLIA